MSSRVAGDGKGDASNAGGSEPRKRERGQALGTLGSDAALPQGDEASGPSRGEAEAPIRVKVQVTVRRVRIKPRGKREEYVARLERIIMFCEGVINNPGSVEEVQLLAFDVIIRAIRMSYMIVKDVDVENLERLTEEVKTQLKERHQPSPV